MSLAKHSLLAGLLLLSGFRACLAADILVLDRNHLPVRDVAVWIEPIDPQQQPDTTEAEPTPTVVMNQSNRQFVPHILSIRRGTEVSFPNHDRVKHHVYSFSEAKTFEIKLYSGETAPLVQFDEPGIVVLGCNIHDQMLAYIVVVDTPWHGVTDATGTFSSNLPEGRYQVKIWHPRLHLEDQQATFQFTINSEQPSTITLRRPMNPALNGYAESREFDDY